MADYNTLLSLISLHAALLIVLSMSGLFSPCLPRSHAFSLYLSGVSDALVGRIPGVCRSELTGYGMWSIVALAPIVGQLGIRNAGLSKAAGCSRIVGMRISS